MTKTFKHIAKTRKKVRIVAYLRVSVERDATGSFTFETQKKRIIEKLNELYGPDGYDVIFIEDDGASGSWGYKPTPAQPKVRSGLKEVAELISNDQVDVVIIYALNRLYRDMTGLSDFINNIMKPNGVDLKSATENIDINDEQSMFMILLTGLVYENERAGIIKRCKDAAATRAENGLPVGGVGFGWQRDPNKESGRGERRGIVPNEDQKAIVIKMKDLLFSGWSTNKIAGELNRLRVPSPLLGDCWSKKAENQRCKNGRETKWTHDGVSRILRNPLHAGLIVFHDKEPMKGQHYEQRFWDPEVFYQIEEQFENRKKRFKTCTGQENMSHLLAGLIYCSRCGNRLYVSCADATNRDYRSYRCSTGCKQGVPTCPGMRVRAQLVEDAVVEEIAKLSKDPFMLRLLDKEIRRGAGKQDDKLKIEKIQIKQRLAQNEEKLNSVLDLRDKREVSDSQFKKRLRKLDEEEIKDSARLEEIEKTLANLKGRELSLKQMQKQLEDFPSIWGELGNDEKRQVLLLLIDEDGLKVDRDGRDIILRLKLQLLPEVDRRIITSSYRGVARSKATGLQLLTLRQIELLRYAAQGKNRRECATLMGCKQTSIISVEKTIRKNLGGVTWAEAMEMSKIRVQTYIAQFPLVESRRKTNSETTPRPFISPVLMEVFEPFAKRATVLEVSKQLGLSPTTVQGRRSRILKLMGTSSILEAAEKAREWGILAA
jgi:site-specific DNA recombinase